MNPICVTPHKSQLQVIFLQSFVAWLVPQKFWCLCTCEGGAMLCMYYDACRARRVIRLCAECPEFETPGKC